jgi:N-acetylmuramate 1-kinase
VSAETLERRLQDEQATAVLGQDLAVALRPGDVLALSGDLGAGKSTLARALIRANANEPALEVPSPTFTLVQSYDGRVPVSHFDLYRLGSSSELDELGLGEILIAGAAVIEWPENAGDLLPAGTVKVKLEPDGDGRRALISGSGPLFERARRSLAMRNFLAGVGAGEADRVPFPGDASARGYETIKLPSRPPMILMNSPKLVLGPPVKDGKPYAVIAHTAQTVSAFVAIAGALRQRGFAAPQIYAADLDDGFVLLEHLGNGHFLEDGQPVAARYAAAGALLAGIHQRDWPSRLPVAPGVAHEVPPFDRAALMIEVELLLDWYVPWKTGKAADTRLRTAFAGAWNAVFDQLDFAEKSIVLRDIHSPNLIWRDDRSGNERIGILDFQDAMIGPAAYDVASLAMDARVTVSREIERAVVDAYVTARHRQGSFDEAGFGAAYAITAAQRNTKILGIFVRLDRRDGKPAYLKHLARIRAYLRRALVHPVLAPVTALYESHGLLEDEA